MKFLFVPTLNSIFDIPWELQNMHHMVDVLNTSPLDPNKYNTDQISHLTLQLKSNKYDHVISYLFIPDVSNVCADLNISYISWTYDSPLPALFTQAVFHSTNYTFIFDKLQCERLADAGAPHIFHMPLAVNLDRTGYLDITKDDESKYSHDISFIGSLYEKNIYNELISAFPDELQLQLKLYLMKNMCHWENIRPWPVLPRNCMEFLKRQTDISGWNPTTLMSDEEYLGQVFFPRKLAELERVTILNTLGQSFNVDLYTNSPTNFIENVNVHSGVDYYTDMNKIFYLSKINLNITLPSIESGIPQRILDIMGCGGFVLTNHQPELDEFFDIGKDVEVFRSVEELKDKCSYYLTHETERLKIAINGYKKIRDSFTYEHQLNKIISIVQGGRA